MHIAFFQLNSIIWPQWYCDDADDDATPMVVALESSRSVNIDHLDWKLWNIIERTLVADKKLNWIVRGQDETTIYLLAHIISQDFCCLILLLLSIQPVSGQLESLKLSATLSNNNTSGRKWAKICIAAVVMYRHVGHWANLVYPNGYVEFSTSVWSSSAYLPGKNSMNVLWLMKQCGNWAEFVKWIWWWKWKPIRE